MGLTQVLNLNDGFLHQPLKHCFESGFVRRNKPLLAVSFASVSVASDTGSVGTSPEHGVTTRSSVYSKADDTFDQTHSWT